MTGVYGGITLQNVISGAQARLMQHRLGLQGCEDFYQWLSGYSAADLQAPPLSMSAADAQALLNAFADAHQEYVMHNGGSPTATIPYPFGASQRQVIGPQT